MSPYLANPLKRFFSHYLPVQKGLAGNTILAYRDAFRLLLCYAADKRHKRRMDWKPRWSRALFSRGESSQKVAHPVIF